MRRLRGLIAIAAAMLLAATLPVLAADLTGRYVGIAETEGTTINLQQDGTTLTGQIVGQNVGELTGTVEGETFSGGIELTAGVTLPFEGKTTADGVDLTIAGANGSILAQFKRDEGVQLDISQYPQHLYHFKDNVQFGPLNLPQVVARYEAGEIAGSDLVWTGTQAGWVPLDTLPDFAGLIPPPLPGSETAAGETAEVDPLRAMLQTVLDAQYAFLTLPDRMLIVDCAMTELAVLSEADKKLLVDTDFNPPAEDAAAFDARNPGVIARAFGCDYPGKAGGPPRSSIELMDGRIVAISGYGTQSLDVLDDGVAFTVGATTITFAGGTLKINSVAEDVAFEHSLEIQVAEDGTIRTVADQ